MFDSELIQSAWKHFDDHCSIHKGVKNSIPILFFGNYEKYKASKLKVITVGLNPSAIEFKTKKGEKARFEDSQIVRDNPTAYIKTLGDYFSKNPYCKWFNHFEKLLQCLQCTFYDSRYPATHSNTPEWWKKQSNVALHTDICTPMATDPTWTGLSKLAQEALSGEGFLLWAKLASYLKPDIIVISVGEGRLERIFHGDRWSCLGDPLPYGAGVHQPKYIDFGYGKIILLRASTTPVAMKDYQLPEIAKRIKGLLK